MTKILIQYGRFLAIVTNRYMAMLDAPISVAKQFRSLGRLG